MDFSCQHTDFYTRYDVGWDIHEEGEQRQHMDHCNDCGAWRFRMEDIPFAGDAEIHLGNWQTEVEAP